MSRNPYDAPGTNVVNPAISEWRRVKWTFGGLAVVLAVLSVLNGALKPPPPPPSAVLVTVFCIFALILATLAARDVWMLKVRRTALWVDLLVYVFALGGLAILIYVRETGVLVWNMLHFEIPGVVYLGIIAVAAGVTEARKQVRVYFGARTLVFIHDRPEL